MASNLATIGLATTAADDLGVLVERLAAEAAFRLVTEAGEYAIWRSGSGAEVWLHVPAAAAGAAGGTAEEREIVGLTPFFEGQSEVLMGLAEAFQRDGDNAFEGAFHGWVAPDEDGAGAYPLVFDAIDFAAQQGRDLPANRRVRLCGFAREVTAYPDETAFSAAQTEGPGFAPQSFFPVGLFAAASGSDGVPGFGASTGSPSSHALLSGRVADLRQHTNEVTAQTFLALSVESLEARFDIVASPEIVTGQIVPGGIVQVACWMFGRILD